MKRKIEEYAKYINSGAHHKVFHKILYGILCISFSLKELFDFFYKEFYQIHIKNHKFTQLQTYFYFCFCFGAIQYEIAFFLFSEIVLSLKECNYGLICTL